MQISTGTVQLTANSSRLIAAPGVDWSKALVGCFFIRSGQPLSYQVAAFAPPATSVSGNWEAMLTAPYAGATEAAAGYVLHISFTANGLPIWTAGDTETTALVNRLTLIMEALLSGVGVTAGNVSLVQQVQELVADKDTIINTDTNARQKVAIQGQGDATRLYYPQ